MILQPSILHYLIQHYKLIFRAKESACLSHKYAGTFHHYLQHAHDPWSNRGIMEITTEDKIRITSSVPKMYSRPLHYFIQLF